MPESTGVSIHVRSFADQPLRFLTKADHIQAIYDAIRELSRPRIAIFVGSGYHGYLESLLLAEHTALCIIPEAWVRHIPLQSSTHRARFAVQLLEAHVNEPIQLLRGEQESLWSHERSTS